MSDYRVAKLKPCLNGCGEMVATKANLKRCDNCNKEMWRVEATKRRKERKSHRMPAAPYQESAAAIEAAYQAALKVVRAERGQREILLGWKSTLARVV